MKLVLVSVLALTTSLSAMAQVHLGIGHHGGNMDLDYLGAGKERIQLHLNQHLRGQNTIALKRELRMQSPGMQLRDLELQAVRVVAKSKRGMGEITLSVNHRESYPVAVQGAGRQFHSESPHTFDRVKIPNPAISSAGKWQLHTRGNIKIKKVVLIVKKKVQVQTIAVTVRDQIHGFGTIKLKRLLRQQNPYLDLSQSELMNVTLVAKSARGRAQATLVIGHAAGYPSTIHGSPRQFQNNHPRSFSVTTLDKPMYASLQDGKLQVEIQGKVKVKEVILTLKTKSQPDNGGFGGGRGGRPARRENRL